MQVYELTPIITNNGPLKLEHFNHNDSSSNTSPYNLEAL